MRPRWPGYADSTQSKGDSERTADSAHDCALCCGRLYLSSTSGSEWSVRDGSMAHGNDSGFIEWSASRSPEQPGDMCTDRNAINDHLDANEGERDMSEVTMNIDFPFKFDRTGRTATANDDDHVRDMIEQFLFTNPGERVNRPDFGSGLLQLIFAPDSPELAAALQLTIQAGLQRWLGDVIKVQALEVTSEDATVRVSVKYMVRRTQEARAATFERSTAP
jgi:phage baseplate assembly protein W